LRTLWAATTISSSPATVFRYVVDVADTVELEIEIEVGDENSLEIEISW